MMQNQEYMTVGELAQKFGISIRTLQYYDKENLIKPSAQSSGGRRLYTYKDMVKLHQILSMKYLGFSLEDIKNRLISLDTPEEVIEILENQSQILKENIEKLNEALTAINALQIEVKQMQTVDFSKYADIIKLLQMKNENYWVVRLFDDKMMTHLKNRFTEDSSKLVISEWQRLCEEIAILKEMGEMPDGVRGQKVAKEWWDMIIDFTGGDLSLLSELEKFNKNKENWNSDWIEKQAKADEFINKALQTYLKKQGIVVPNTEVKDNG